jgi:putative thioredoxin
MSSKKFIEDATPENFSDLVIGNSMRGPVLVNYWSAKAGPCLKLWPVLEKLAHEFAGKFLLVNFNTDKYFDFARQHLGVTSVPVVKMYRQQQVVDVIHGAESESSFRRMIEKQLPRPSDALLLDAVNLYQQGQVDAALAELQVLQKQDADNPRILLTWLRLLFREGRLTDLLAQINVLPDSVQKNEDIINLQTHAGFILAAQKAPAAAQLQNVIMQQPDNLDARYQMSALHLVADQYSEAMDQLLQIIVRNRGYANDAAVKGMVTLLNMVNNDESLTKTYRQKMMDALNR